MVKKLKGYFSLEASLILPMVLFLYLMIILAALFLYCRCVISQDSFLLSMRAGRFTFAGREYGEVIYGENVPDKWQAETYVQERLQLRKDTYPFFPYTGGTCEVTMETVTVRTWSGEDHRISEKCTQRINPVMRIREGRK
ncbi:MAG: hypothetical protein NC429_12145 [Lachnospiraceae bacterium]|nr:hypothetical protein [Lachnospiraceae bacterium]